MQRRAFLSVAAALLVASCGPSITAPTLGPDGKPLPRAYRIPEGSTAKIEYSMLDSVNALRQAAGAPALELNAKLNAAAATHSRDMAVQNRPWHFGSDGSSPIDRVNRVGYTGRLVGENISETYETELETLAAWMEEPATRNVILDAAARDMALPGIRKTTARSGGRWSPERRACLRPRAGSTWPAPPSDRDAI